MGVLATIIPGAFGVFFCFGINFWEEPLKESTIKKICNDPLVDIDVKLEIAKELSYKKSSITRNKLIYIK